MRKKTDFLTPETDLYLLSDDELANPATVFNELFKAYNLDALRHRLRDMMESALSDRDRDAKACFLLFKHLEKMVEAAHVMSKPLQRDDSAAVDDLSSDDQIEEKFYKPPRFEEIAALRPWEALEQTFGACNANDLIDEIEKWKRCVMTGSDRRYNETSLREHLWTFCDQLMCLVESAHTYYHEQRLPEKEMEKFFSRFTLTYAQRELWDFFEAVTDDEREDADVDKASVTLTYRCLLPVIVATYYLLENSEPSSSTMPFEKMA